jgi:hypothetical protein
LTFWTETIVQFIKTKIIDFITDRVSDEASFDRRRAGTDRNAVTRVDIAGFHSIAEDAIVAECVVRLCQTDIVLLVAGPEHDTAIDGSRTRGHSHTVSCP